MVLFREMDRLTILFIVSVYGSWGMRNGNQFYSLLGSFSYFRVGPGCA